MKIIYIGMPLSFCLLISSIWLPQLFAIGVMAGIASLGIGLAMGMAEIEHESELKKRNNSTKNKHLTG